MKRRVSRGRAAPGLPKGTVRTSSRTREFDLLRQIYSVLAVGADMTATLRRTAGRVARVLGAEVCGFLLHDETSGDLVFQSGSWGLPETRDPLRFRVRADDVSSYSGRVFLTRKPLLLSDTGSDRSTSARSTRFANYRSLLVVPLIVGKRCIGVLRAGHRRANRFSTGGLRLAALVAEHAAVVVENARLYRRVQEDVEQLRRLDRMKSEFLSMVSHELQSPLTSVLSFADLLLQGEAGPVSGRQKDILSLCRASLDRVMLLIRDLLDHGRIESGLVSLKPEPVDCRGLAAESFQAHGPMASEKGISLSLEDSATLPLVTADPHRLRQVIDNLLGNALKFTPKGGKVVLSLRRGEGGVVVSIRDTGIGLSETEKERIFEKYYQATPGASRRVRGTGLGLAIAKSLVEHQGGRIWVDSSPGAGSDFQFSLPAADA